MTIGIQHVNDLPLIRFEIRLEFESYPRIRFDIGTEISDSQVPKIGTEFRTS